MNFSLPYDTAKYVRFSSHPTSISSRSVFAEFVDFE
jgi:hypothetical protein